MNIPILGTIWNAWKALLKTMWDFALQGWTWIVGIIMVCITAISALVDSVMEICTTMAEKFTAVVAPNSDASQSVGDWLTIANGFAPVQEAFGIIVALSALWVLMLTYRLIKSFIPTLS
jgi:hypothetical protein